MTRFDFKENMYLENERVRLEPLEKKHSELLKPIIRKDEGLMKLSSISVLNEDEVDVYVDIALDSRAKEDRYPFLVFDKLKGRYAGSTSFLSVSNPDDRLEIGYTWIGYDFQRTGLNRAMKYLMLEYAFETMGFIRVEFRADSRNEQSRKAMEDIGAVFEGELRSRAIKPDGFRSNTVFYSILADEWPQIKKERFLHATAGDAG